jgi:hypothetical protein
MRNTLHGAHLGLQECRGRVDIVGDIPDLDKVPEQVAERSHLNLLDGDRSGTP